MPTTSGTGSEVARGAILIVDDRCHKTNPRLATRQDYRDMLLASM